MSELIDTFMLIHKDNFSGLHTEPLHVTVSLQHERCADSRFTFVTFPQAS